MTRLWLVRLGRHGEGEERALAQSPPTEWPKIHDALVDAMIRP